MHRSHFKSALKLLTFLSTTSIAFSISLIITIPLLGWEGLGRTYQLTPQSCTYFKQKYEAQLYLKLSAYYITTILSAICLLGQNLLVIKTLFNLKRLQQNNLHENAIWTKFQAGINYILISCFLLLLLPVLSFYFSLVVEKKGESQKIPYDWIIILVESFVPFVFMLISWIRSITLASQCEASSELATNIKQEDAQDQNQQMIECRMANLRQQRFKEDKPIETKSTFEMDGAEDICEIIKDTNPKKGMNQKLLIINNAIPLFSEEIYEAQQIKVTKNKNSTESKVKMNLLEEIHRRKKRFRQINPFQEFIITEQGQGQDSSFPQVKGPKLTKLPKTYSKYIKEAMRPPRKISMNQFYENRQKNDEKLTNSLSISGNPRIPNCLKEKALGHVQGQQLVFNKRLKGKRRMSKQLFDELGLKGSQQVNNVESDGPQDNRRKKKAKRAPTQQEKIINQLKRKYSQNEQILQ